nr:hypothetical transcript [Hymenolepis microstoma]
MGNIILFLSILIALFYNVDVSAQSDIDGAKNEVKEAVGLVITEIFDKVKEGIIKDVKRGFDFKNGHRQN